MPEGVGLAARRPGASDSEARFKTPSAAALRFEPELCKPIGFAKPFKGVGPGDVHELIICPRSTGRELAAFHIRAAAPTRPSSGGHPGDACAGSNRTATSPRYRGGRIENPSFESFVITPRGAVTPENRGLARNASSPSLSRTLAKRERPGGESLADDEGDRGAVRRRQHLRDEASVLYVGDARGTRGIGGPPSMRCRGGAGNRAPVDLIRLTLVGQTDTVSIALSSKDKPVCVRLRRLKLAARVQAYRRSWCRLGRGARGQRHWARGIHRQVQASLRRRFKAQGMIAARGTGQAHRDGTEARRADAGRGGTRRRRSSARSVGDFRQARVRAESQRWRENRERRLWSEVTKRRRIMADALRPRVDGLRRHVRARRPSSRSTARLPGRDEFERA